MSSEELKWDLSNHLCYKWSLGLLFLPLPCWTVDARILYSGFRYHKAVFILVNTVGESQPSNDAPFWVPSRLRIRFSSI